MLDLKNNLKTYLKMDKFDMSSSLKQYAIDKLKEVEKSDSNEFITYSINNMAIRYKNEENDLWLAQGDIIKIGTSYFIYLGTSKPRQWPAAQLTHHIMDNKGERFKWKLGTSLEIKRVNV